MSILARVREQYNDPEYFNKIRETAIPIIIQQLMFSLLNMLGVVLVAQKGDVAVASVGVAGQVAFVLQLIHFGIISGAAMFTAQFWGRQDVLNLRRVLGLCLMLATGSSLIFLLLSQFAPEAILGIYSNDPEVIAVGARYLRIFSWSFVVTAVTFSYAFVMRSSGDVKTPTFVNVGALLLSTFLSYSLIFGKFGFPEAGVTGAAIAAVVARSAECLALLAVTYARRSPVAASLRQLTDFDRAFFGRVIRPMLPVMLNELFWVLGITSYNIIYGRMGTESFAAMNIVGTIEQLAFVFFIGISNATSVLVGNRIGAGKEEEAHRYAGRSLGIAVAGGLVMGLVIQLVKAPALSLYNVSPEVLANASRVLTVVSFFVSVRVCNMLIVIGILRAGGDTRYSLFLDGIIIWLVGVPMAYLGANYFHFPVYLVYLCAMSEEATKLILGIRRYRSRKWIHNLTSLTLVE